jgi:hypothetical protein
MKKAATQKSNDSISIDTKESTRIRPPFKIELCVDELTIRSIKGMNELEALQAYGETCLHTTISTLANKHGLIINRRSEPHNHMRGGVTHFTRYSLVDELSKRKALDLLVHYQKRRGVWREAA